MNWKYTFFYILVLLTGNIYSQWHFSIGSTQAHSGNPFNSPIPTSTFISSIDFGIEKEFTSLNFGYYGNNFMFHDIPERNYYWHQFGLWSATDSTMFGIYLEQRLNNHDYSYFDYMNYNAYYKHKLTIGEFNFIGNAGISFTNYGELDDLDNVLGTGTIVVNKSFETKTTLLGGVNFNYKNYISTNLNDSILNGDSLHSNSNTAFTTQLNYFIRVAQSLFETTGLAVQFSKQNIIGGTAAYVRELDYFYGDESQFFDDPISFEGYSMYSQLTQIFPLDIILRLSYSYNYKDYPSHGVYLTDQLFDDDKIRNDKQQQLNLGISKTFYWGEDSKYQIHVSLNYFSINNNSNSYWYDYESSGGNLGINFQF